MFLGIIQFLFILIGPLLWFSLGQFVLSSGAALLPKVSKTEPSNLENIPKVNILIFGLLFYLLTAFALFSLGVPIGLASCVALVPGLLSLHDEFISFSWKDFKPTANFALWFAVIFALGLCLFSAASDITTPWTNNYGDITFHFGMITSFVFGENSIPEYPIYPGAVLSYHFLINFWSACLWWVNPNFFSLSLIFAYQWIFVWLIVYFCLNGDRKKVLPWAILFAGGSYLYFFQSIQALTSGGVDKWAHEFIDQGLPWTPLLTTIWIPQRPSLLGLLVALPCLKLFHDFIASGSGRAKLVVAVLTLSLTPLAHTTFFIILSVYILAVLSLSALFKLKFRRPILISSDLKKSVGNLLIAGLSLTPCLLTIPWLLGKVSVVSFNWGWMPWPKSKEPLVALFNAVSMWLDNAALWFLLVLLLIAFSKNKFAIPIVVLAALILVANFIQIGIWNWDHVKCFIGLYLITISIIAHFEIMHPRLLGCLITLMIVPALYETGKVLINYKDHVVYNKEGLRLAEEIREFTEPSAIIASAPKHNSIVTLTGRRIFSGYGGTLYSHGIAYGPRRDFSKDLSNIINCSANRSNELPGIGVCPQYLLWTKMEAENWKGGFPLVEKALSPVIDQSLYALP